jgi:two-component system, LytTR family, response regulator LytT
MNILIVEDEILIAQGLVRSLKAYFGSRIKRLDHFSQLEAAIEKIQTSDIDLVLLDLNLFGQDGFDILQLTNASSFHTIVVSAYADLAIRAFEFGVLDFVAKPFTQDRLTKALQRFDNQSSHHALTQSLAVKKLGQLQLLAIQDINYIQADGHYSQIWMTDGSSHLHDKSIERLLNILPNYFLRTHRSFAVNLHHVKQIKIETGGKYSVDTFNFAAIPLSRSYYASLKSLLST